MRRARLAVWPLAICVILCWAADARAYSWMMRHGYGGCINCHADPSGGELLTPYGYAQGDLLLRMHYGSDSTSGAASDGGEDEEVDFDSFDRYDYITRTCLGEMTAEIFMEEALKFVDACPRPSIETRGKE